MGADLCKPAQTLCKPLCHNTGFQRTQPYPFNPFYFVQFFNEAQQAFFFVCSLTRPFPAPLFHQIHPIRTEMDPCQDDFPASCVCKSHGFLADRFRPAASDSSSDIGNNTIRTKLIASILDFQKSSCMLRAYPQSHLLIGHRTFRIQYGNPLRLRMPTAILPVLQKCFQYGDQLIFLMIADCQINALVLTGILAGLHIAAHCHHHGFPVLLSGFMQHLSALSVGNIGYRACIDNIDIRRFVKGHNFISLFLQHLPHYIQFISIYLASQIVQCHTFHSFPFHILSGLNLDIHIHYH